MHDFKLTEAQKALAASYCGAPHVYATLDPRRTALVVIDMQNYFMAPGEQCEVPMARKIVPNVNRLARAVRERGGHVVWVQTAATPESRQSWSVLHDTMMSTARRDERWLSVDPKGKGFPLWPELEALPEDGRIVKYRFSAFIQGASDIEPYLRERGLDMLLIAGTATNVCCESSARDAMMLNFKVAMVSDALATYSEEAHAASLLTFYGIFGDVLTIDEAIAGMGKAEAQRRRA
ncbi:MAG TPA: isochorismatase family cysteine hydrolase [Alphaproteobacteria bacterium]|jgi:nicotinamidase-related amidase|nr:isochorismatase family cysteine hydrolase [Alphaproteobacteria bacterium]